MKGDVVLFRMHWSDNESKLGPPRKCTIQRDCEFTLPFVYVHARNILTAKLIVQDFNREWFLHDGRLPEGLNPVHIPLGLMAKHGILPRSV